MVGFLAELGPGDRLRRIVESRDGESKQRQVENEHNIIIFL
jgi:hypothetical protein